MAPRRGKRRAAASTTKASSSGPTPARNGRAKRPRPSSVAAQGPQYLTVRGEEILVARVYDINNYDPERPVPGTPEPRPRASEAVYTAWGRRRFGEEWYRRRETMLRERNVYLKPPDPVYWARQMQLRRLERAVEGRPTFDDGMDHGLQGDQWKQVWARLQERGGLPTPSPASSPEPDRNDESDRLSGYSTYDEVSSREPSPQPSDPIKRLEYRRQSFGWKKNQEQYHHDRALTISDMVDEARKRRENEPGDRQLAAAWEDLERFAVRPTRNRGGYILLQSDEYTYRKNRLQRLAEGATVAQLDANKSAFEAKLAAEAELRRVGPVTQWAMDHQVSDWEHRGVSRDEQDRLTRMYGFLVQRWPDPPAPPRPPMLTRDPPPRTPAEMDALVLVWSNRRIFNDRELNELRRMYGFPVDGAAAAAAAAPDGAAADEESAAPASTPAAAGRAGRKKTARGRVTKTRAGVPAAASALAGAPKRKKRQERPAIGPTKASRRLAGRPPEFGLLEK